MKRVSTVALVILLVVVPLVGAYLGGCSSGQPQPTSSESSAEVALKPVDYPETHPLVAGQFDSRHYPRYDEVISLLKGWAAKYPGLVDIYSVGTTYEGREIWQMAVTNKATGIAESKPAMYVGGNIHSEEVTACVAAMDFANTLLTGYGTDPEVTNLLDTRAFYVRPTENPDGTELFLGTAQYNRSSVHPYDNDGDGRADEDPPEDLDGDGFITMMYKATDSGKGGYAAYTEGIDNDGDGKYNEDGIGGIDLNRNFPVNWRPAAEVTGAGWTQTQSGSPGEYPLSEPETRASYLFFTAHPNISIIQSMHTNLPMYLHSPTTSHPEESMPGTDSTYYDYLDIEAEKLQRFIPAGDAYHDFTQYGEDVPMFGSSMDFYYFGLGAIGYNDELWGYGAWMKSADLNGDGVFDNDDLEVLIANAPALQGRIYIEEKEFDHPTLGKVLIGGFESKFWTRNPPAGDLLAKVVTNETKFNLLLAKSLPLVKVSEPSVKANPDGTHTVTITVANEGFLPDALKQAYLVKSVKPSKATIKLGEGMTVAASTPADQEIGFFSGALPDDDTTFAALSNMTWARSRKVSWIIQGSGDATVTVRSTRGGAATTTCRIP